MELSKVGNKISNAGKNKQCTIQAKDITIDIMSRTLVDLFMMVLLQIYFINAIILYQKNIIFII